MNLGEYCNREVIIMRREETARDAARIMREQHVGDVVVVDDSGGSRTPLGIVTDRDLVIEILGEETAERDRAPRGAKFLAYQLSGVREYLYAWPDGREAAAFRLEDGVFRPVEPDADGFFPSRVLGASLRLVPAALRGA